MKEIKYDINAVIGRLSAKIANLEAQLAYEQTVNEAYAKRIQELESKNEEENAE